MRVRFFSNSFYEIQLNTGIKVVCDPWIEEGAFYGSMWHYPPFRVPDELYANIDYIFISHFHPDHFHPSSLRRFPSATPIIISERKTPVLRNLVGDAGFKNIVELATGCEHEVDGIKVRLWNDFCGVDVARKDGLPFEIDSAIAFIEGETILFNANDNVLEPASARDVRELYPDITCAMLPYAGGASFPSVYENLGHDEKMAARLRLQRRFLENFVAVAEILDARMTVPVAAEYVMVGKNADLMPYFHAATPDEIEQEWKRRNLSQKLVQLGAHDMLDLETGEVERPSGRAPSHSHEDRIAYARSLASEVMSIDRFSIPEELRLPPSRFLALLNKARTHLAAAQARSGIYPEWTIWFSIEDYGDYQAWLGDASHFVPSDEVPSTAYLKVRISYDKVIAMLTTHAAWNNLDVACHLRFFRDPDVFDPDLHTVLSFLHL